MSFYIDSKNDASDQIVAALDIGSTKICCLIARRNTLHSQKEIGCSYQKIEPEQNALEEVIREVLLEAEKQAQTYLNSIVVNALESRSMLVSDEVQVQRTYVEHHDIQNVVNKAWNTADVKESHPLHSFPLVSRLENGNLYTNPIGVQGRNLNARIHFIVSSAEAVRQVRKYLKSSKVPPIKEMVSAAYASGLGCILPTDELESGCILCLDLGGATTKGAIFYRQASLYTFTIDKGGQTITRKIAEEFSLPPSQAEHLKITYGNLGDRREDEIEWQGRGLERQVLNQSIRAEVETILKICSLVINNLGLDGVPLTVLLTGGASQIRGLEDLTERLLLAKVVKTRAPRTDSYETSAPEFATAVGLMRYPYALLRYPFCPQDRFYWDPQTSKQWFDLKKWQDLFNQVFIHRWLKSSFLTKFLK